MARHEADREDLYEEFRSAVQKWEIQTSGFSEPVVLGVRKDGRFSIYFDQDHCYHFNSGYQLLRAYRAGSLYRTQGTTLAKLTRTRTEKETILNRVDLNERELSEFLEELETYLQDFSATLTKQQYEVLRSQPAGLGIAELQAALQRICQSKVQLAPAYATKRK